MGERIAVGAACRWREDKHPGVEFIGEVVQFVPAGTPFKDVLPSDAVRFRGINPFKLSSSRDRYVVRVDGEHGPYRLPRADRLEVK